MNESSSQIEENIEHFGFRDGNVFVIDVAPEMFESDPDSGETFFSQCLLAYGRILSQKLMWNKRDWMGLIFYNSTKNWDHDPETEQILTVQKFSEVSSDMLRGTLNILNTKMSKEDYCDPSLNVNPDKCLHDVLWQASRTFDAIKIAMPVRQVVLLTRRDDPLPNDTSERHKIRLRAKTYRDINVTLRIVGLGKEWNEDLFYKDLDMLANNSVADGTKITKLVDLEPQIKFPARTSGHLTWRIGKDLEIPTMITSFSSKTKYLKKVRLHKDTNEVLEVHTHFGPSRQFDDDLDDEEDVVLTRIPDYVRKGMKFGGKTITFNASEVKKIRLSTNVGIDLIGFRPISMDWIYHIKATKFVGIDKTASKEAKSLFAALLSKCKEKEVMAICSVTHRASPYLAKLIPRQQLDGFYMCKIAYTGQVRNLKDDTSSYIYDRNDEETLPVDEQGVALMKKIIRKLRRPWNPLKFTNPKLNRQLAYIEALELELEAETPEDSTRANHEKMAERLGDLVNAFENMFGNVSSHGTKRTAGPRVIRDKEKKAKLDDLLILDLIKSDRLKNETCKVLKTFAQSIGVQTTGLKSQLIERITEHYRTKNA